MKTKYYSVKASKEQNEDISFCKTENGLVKIHMGYSEIEFTTKECREIIEKLKKCISENG